VLVNDTTPNSTYWQRTTLSKHYKFCKPDNETLQTYSTGLEKLLLSGSAWVHIHLYIVIASPYTVTEGIVVPF
jgi:hypothetical protein